MLIEPQRAHILSNQALTHPICLFKRTDQTVGPYQGSVWVLFTILFTGDVALICPHHTPITPTHACKCSPCPAINDTNHLPRRAAATRVRACHPMLAMPCPGAGAYTRPPFGST